MLLYLLLCGGARGQNVSCSLSGTVQDSAQALVPGAVVSVTAEMTGFVRNMKTNEAGFFSFPDLAAGTLSLTVATPGFKKYEQKGIAMGSGDQRSLGAIVLAVGEVTESVTVTAESAPVQLGSSEKAGVIGGDEIQGMALRGRDFFDAARNKVAVDPATGKTYNQALIGTYVPGENGNINLYSQPWLTVAPRIGFR